MWGHALIFSLIPLVSLGKVMSMDMCADRWVLDTYHADEIMATTYFTKTNTRHHSGTTEEILALKPSIIVSEFPLSPKQIYHFKKHNISLKTLPALHRLEDLYKRFPQAHSLKFPSIGLGKRVFTLTQNLHTPGAQTFWDDILKALGFVNLSARAGVQGWGYLSTEKILALKPDLLIIFGQETTLPPCLKALPMKRIAEEDYLCPSPISINKMIESLR